MGIFDKFRSKPTPPPGYAGVKVTFTAEEAEAISRNRKMYVSIADADAPEGMEMIVTQKVRDAISAQGLTRYVEDLMMIELPHCNSDSETAAVIDKAIKATIKAYSIHNLPIYLFQIAEMFELTGDADNAKEFFSQFLLAQSEFRPDQVDTGILNHAGFDIPEGVAMAKTKIG